MKINLSITRPSDWDDQEWDDYLSDIFNLLDDASMEYTEEVVA